MQYKSENKLFSFIDSQINPEHTRANDRQEDPHCANPRSNPAKKSDGARD